MQTIVTIPSTAAYKPWAYTSSQGHLGGLINGGAYIRNRTDAENVVGFPNRLQLPFICLKFVLQFLKFTTSARPELHFIDKGNELKVCSEVHMQCDDKTQQHVNFQPLLTVREFLGVIMDEVEQINGFLFIVGLRRDQRYIILIRVVFQMFFFMN